MSVKRTSRQTQARVATLAILSALILFGIGRGRSEQSADYSFDYAQQNNGGGLGSSTTYDVSDGIRTGDSENTSQGSGNYSVGSPLQLRLAQTNGVGAGFGTTLELVWPADGTPGIQGYDVYRSLTPSGPFTQVNSGHLPGAAFSDTGLGNGTYYYQVYVIDSGGGMTLWKTLVGTVSSVKGEVWVDFAWAGDQSGDPFTPYHSLQNAIPWVESGGALVIQPGTTPETVRITKPMLILNATPGQTLRIGAGG